MCSRSELKPNLKFDYVPIKQVNVGNGGDDWLRTDTFLSIVSKLSKEEDVKRAGGFMVIRPKNYKGAIPYICPKEQHDIHTKNYNPRHFDFTENGLTMHHLYGIPNLEHLFEAQIHNQKCYQLKEQMFKWNNKQIYDKDKTVKQKFEINDKNINDKNNEIDGVQQPKKRKRGRPRKDENKNNSNMNVSGNKSSSMNKTQKLNQQQIQNMTMNQDQDKNKNKPKHSHNLKHKQKHKHKMKKRKDKSISFDVIRGENGEAITQTQSGRIIKVSSKKAQQQNMFAQLDKYLDGDDDDDDDTNNDSNSGSNSSSNNSNNSEDSDCEMSVNDNKDRKRKREEIGNYESDQTKSTQNTNNSPPAKKRKLIKEEKHSTKIKIPKKRIFTLNFKKNHNNVAEKKHVQKHKVTIPVSDHKNAKDLNQNQVDDDDDVDMNEPNAKMVMTESGNETSDASNTDDTSNSKEKGVKYDNNNSCIIKTSNKIPKKRAKPGFKYQYPYQLKPSMPEPDENDTTEPSKDYRLETRDSYKKVMSVPSKPKSQYKYSVYSAPHDNHNRKEKVKIKVKVKEKKSFQYQYHHQQHGFYQETKQQIQTPKKRSIQPLPSPSISVSPLEQKAKAKAKAKPKPKSRTKPKPKMHINRGFACVIEQLEERKKKQIQHFWNKQEFKQQLRHNLYDGKSPEEVPLIFGDYLASAKTVQYAILDSNSVYHFESPLQLSALSRYGPFSALHLDEIMLGIELPYVYIGQQHTFFPFHREDMNLFATNHLLWGCEKLWYCIHPKDHKKVISFVRKQYCLDPDTPENLKNCQTPLQHKLFWFDPYILLSMGIKVFFIRQKPGDIVITPPGGIHGGLNSGPNMAESINFMTWDIETCWKPVLGAMFYYMHNYNCDVCITHAFLDINRLAQRLREKKEISEDEKELIPDTSVISEPLPITRTSIHFPKYKNEDKYISRSFTWNDRLTLRSRFLNSNEYSKFYGALEPCIVYPLYRCRRGEDGMMIEVYPIKYNGTWQHRTDDLEFIPLYYVSYLHDDRKPDDKTSLDYILTDYGIHERDWQHKFDEESIKKKLMEILPELSADIVADENLKFMYKKTVTKHKKLKKKKIEVDSTKIINSAERRKLLKKKRVIEDSDTSDSD